MPENEDEKRKILEDISEARKVIRSPQKQLAIADKELLGLARQIESSPDSFFTLAKPKILDKINSTTSYILAGVSAHQAFASGVSANVADAAFAWRETAWSVVGGPVGPTANQSTGIPEDAKRFAELTVQRQKDEDDTGEKVEVLCTMLASASHLVKKIQKFYEAYKTGLDVRGVALSFREMVNSLKGELWTLLPENEKRGVKENQRWIAIMEHFGNPVPAAKMAWQNVLNDFNKFINSYNNGLHHGMDIDVHDLMDRFYVLVVNIEQNVLASIPARAE